MGRRICYGRVSARVLVASLLRKQGEQTELPPLTREDRGREARKTFARASSIPAKPIAPPQDQLQLPNVPIIVMPHEAIGSGGKSCCSVRWSFCFSSPPSCWSTGSSPGDSRVSGCC